MGWQSGIGHALEHMAKSYRLSRREFPKCIHQVAMHGRTNGFDRDLAISPAIPPFQFGSVSRFLGMSTFAASHFRKRGIPLVVRDGLDTPLATGDQPVMASRSDLIMHQ
jgi:hypothetical protein